MRLWIKINNKKINLDYRELAEKMWFKEKNGKELEISHGGNTETLQGNLKISLKLDKFLNDPRWRKMNSPLGREYIYAGPIENNEILYLVTDNIEILTVDKRALYIMAIEFAKSLEGDISEEEQLTWLTVEEFEKKHQKVLNLTYEEANDISLDEVKTMKAIEEPWDYDID
ncbi:hypothetical protein [Enterococcus sp. AZ192]|uniref:hypothetical protein n=1 Tax=unclassified Enterococcus TaxID=2608891 RepID=UPI003D2AE394